MLLYNHRKENNKTKQKEETKMIFTAMILCAMIGIAAGLMKAAHESEN